MCTYSDSPSNRETFPVNCLTQDVANAFCAWKGGSLPLEVQWEYAAAAAGRSQRAHYAWGDENPLCRNVVFDRSNIRGIDLCQDFGPAAVTFGDHDGGDITPLSLVDLGGNVREMMSDAFASMSANCWQNAPLTLPSCRAQGSVAIRGGSWAGTPSGLLIAERAANIDTVTDTGFRCVRAGQP
jgi:formylglycine-generating enzyme required for sulfatase activity